MKKFERLWAEIEEEFDWGRVRKTMKALEWEWINGDGESYIPKKKQLKEWGKDLALTAFVENRTASSGGFRANYYDEVLTLEFILEDWTACE